MEVTWTDLAIESLSDILDYVESNFSAEVAERVGSEIVAYVDTLACNPNLGHPAHDWQCYGNIRRLTFRQNVIYYQTLQNTIEVILVWDGRRSPWDMESLMLEFFSSLHRTPHSAD